MRRGIVSALCVASFLAHLSHAGEDTKAVARQLIAEACRQAEQLTDPNELVAVYPEIARAQGRSGDLAPMQKSFERISPAMAQIRQVTLYWLMGEIQIMAGDLAGARETVQKAKETAPHDTNGFEDKAHNYELILRLQLKLNDKTGAEESVLKSREIAQANPRTDTFCTLAKMQIAVGNRTAARESIAQARAIAGKTHSENPTSLPEIVPAYGVAGTAHSAYWSDLFEIARAEAALGDIAAAKATLTRAPKDDLGTTIAYQAIVTAQWKQGDFTGAKETVKLFAPRLAGNRASALVQIAIEEAKAGRMDAARSTISEIQDVFLKTAALQQIASNRVALKDFSGAEAIAAEILKPSSNAKGGSAESLRCTREAFAAMLYVRIAQAQEKAGDQAATKRNWSLAEAAARRSVEAANKAIDALQGEPDKEVKEMERLLLLIQSAAALAITGDATGATATVNKAAETPLFRCQGLAWLADACAAEDGGTVLLGHLGF